MRKIFQVISAISIFLLSGCIDNVSREASCQGRVEEIPVKITYQAINNNIIKSIHVVTYDFNQENEVNHFINYLSQYSKELNNSLGVKFYLEVVDNSVILTYHIDYKLIEKETLVHLGLVNEDCEFCGMLEFVSTILLREEQGFICRMESIGTEKK